MTTCVNVTNLKIFNYIIIRIWHSASFTFALQYDLIQHSIKQLCLVFMTHLMLTLWKWWPRCMSDNLYSMLTVWKSKQHWYYLDSTVLLIAINQIQGIKREEMLGVILTKWFGGQNRTKKISGINNNNHYNIFSQYTRCQCFIKSAPGFFETLHFALSVIHAWKLWICIPAKAAYFTCKSQFQNSAQISFFSMLNGNSLSGIPWPGWPDVFMKKNLLKCGPTHFLSKLIHL
jgi:hypothetical protein